MRRQEQSEFFRKRSIRCSEILYGGGGSCLHGMSELYRVHGIIADTIGEIDGLKDVVDLGYYSCDF